MVALCPDLSAVSQEDTTLITNDDKLKPQQEIIFVVDQSGSTHIFANLSKRIVLT